YDTSGNLTAITYADGTSEHWTYDSMGQATQWTNQRGQAITLEWDSDGRLTRKTYADGTHVDYAYDSRGNLTGTTDSTGTTTFTYDANDYLTRIDYQGGQWLTFTYDAGGRRASSTDQLGNVLNYLFDSAGRLSIITDENTNQVVHYEYDAVGRLARKTLGNGVYTTYGYDAAGELTHLVNNAPDDSVLSRFDYTYDSRGRRTSMATSYGTWTYSYDDMGQLIHAVLASIDPSVADQDLSYGYDALGNRIYTIENGVRTDYTTNRMNQYTTVGDTTYAFDAAGNLVSETSPSGTITYSYDSENRLIAVHEGSDTWTYAYDAFGQRVQADHNGDVTNYVIDPVGLGNVVGEYDSLGNLKTHYDYGFGLLSQTTAAGISSWYTFDALGNTAELTDAAGLVANSYVYAPFGEIIDQTGTVTNPFQFVGEWGVMSEGTGLDFMRARFYDSEVGRFTQADPIGTGGGDIDLYRYSSNDPNLFTDSSGLKCELKWNGIHRYVVVDGWEYHWAPTTPWGILGYTTGVGDHYRRKIMPDGSYGKEEYLYGHNTGYHFLIRNCWLQSYWDYKNYCAPSEKPVKSPKIPTDKLPSRDSDTSDSS
ncbi:RHS repeat protein, partial [bacterium]|nr:RHS repeat protein [bacterium]